MADWESAPAVGGPGVSTPAPSDTPEWQKAPAAQPQSSAWQSAPPVHQPSISEGLQAQTTPTGGVPVWQTLAQGHINAMEAGHDLVPQQDGSFAVQQVRQPAPIPDQLKTAIFDAYRQQYGYGQPQQLETGQRMAVDQYVAQQAHLGQQSGLQNFSNTATQSLAQAGTGLLGTVAPQTAAGLQQNVNLSTPTPEGSNAAFAGGVVGSTLPLVPSLVPGAGPALQTATALGLGASQFGSAREEAAIRRQAGQNVGVIPELTNAASQAVVMALAQKIGLGNLTRPGGALALSALSAAEREGLRDVALQAIKRYATTAGVQASDMAVMQAANNAIGKVTGVTPDVGIGQGVGTAALTGGIVGAVGRGLHEAAGTPENTKVPVPSAETIESLKTAPKESHELPEQPAGEGQEPQRPVTEPTPPPVAAVPEKAAEATRGETAATPAGDQGVQPATRPLLDAAEPKYRLTNGAESRGVPLEFESPEEKALYLATVPRKGKVALEAQSFLQERGYKPADIERYGDELRDRIDGLAKQPPAEGHPLHVPSLGEAEAAPKAEAGLSEKPAAGGGEQAAPVVKAEPSFIPEGEKDHDTILAENNPGATRVKLESLPPEHREVLSDYKQLTGKDMVPYTGGRGRGFNLDGDSYYNVERNNTPQLRRETIAHEATHFLQDSKPSLVDQVERAIPEPMKRSLLKEYQGAYQRQEGKALSTEQHNREIQAMAVGRAFSRPSVAKAVMEQNPGAFSRAANAVLTKLRSLTGTGRATNEIINFLKSAKAQAETREPASTRQVAETDSPNFLPEAHERIRHEAEDYTAERGIPYRPTAEYAGLDEARAKKIADTYAALKHEPQTPEVKKSYDAFKQETMAQWDYLKQQGVKFEPWTKPGQPYADSTEMMKDARVNKHLYFFQGGDLPSDHPLAEQAPGTPYIYNDVFRAVHDYFGHAKEGVGFGPRGEENAWRSHSQMYSEAARPAMTTETRGQNSWVNFGPFGEANRKNPQATVYAEQKANLLPPEYHQVERTGQPSFLPDFKPRGKENKEALAEIKAHLTPEEWDSLNTPEAKRAVDLFKSLPPDQEFEAAIKAGAAKQGWYEKATATINSLFGPDSNRFARLLAATSPRQSVLNNFRESLRIWQGWDEAGRPTDPAKIEDLVLHQPDKLLGLSTRLPNVQRALAEDGPLSGYKVNSFMRNLQGDLSKVTNDTWMAQFGGLDQKVFADNGGYLGFAAKMRRTADAAGVKPAEAQEMIWSFFKTLAEKVNANTTGKEALQNITHEEIGATPAFADMLHDPEIRNGLKQLGISENDLRSAERAASKVGPKQVPSGFVSGSRAGILGPIAERAESVARNQPSESAKAQQPLFLPGSDALKRFHEDDVSPVVTRLGEDFGAAKTGVANFLGLQEGSKAAVAKDILRNRGAELAQRYDRLNTAFADTKKFFDSMPVAQTRAFIDQIEQGGQVSNPALQPVADAIRAIFDDRLSQLQGHGKLESFVKDYFPHLWADPKKAAAVYAAEAKRPFEGTKGFLRQRSLPLFMDGIAKGLEPITENPVEAMMLRVRQMDKYITGQDAIKEMEGHGFLKEIKARDPVPEGYAKLDDPMGTMYAPPNRKKGISIAGYRVAPEPVASVINNSLSPGLRGHPDFGGTFRTYLGAGNMMNQAQLGLSFFHAMATSFNSVISKAAIGLKNAAVGNFKEAGKNAASLPIAPAQDYWNGTKMLREWNKPGSTDADTAAAVQFLKQGGGRAGLDSFYQTGMADKFMEAVRAGNPIGAALRLPGAALDMASKPLMEYFVPRMKMGAYMDMARHELDRLGPNASTDDRRAAAHKAWDSIDNRFGQLVYDNLFWNKAAKDIAMASMRSVGWNLGTFRELGGAAKDTASAASSLVLGRVNGKPELTHRMAYAATLPVVVGAIGGAIHYALTGKHPDELKDYFFPRTGRQDQEGHDVRLALPTYMKDVYAFKKDPLGTITHKVHPMFNTIAEMLENHDYYGTKIRNEDDPWIKQLKDVAEHVGTAFQPFGIREAGKLAGQGQGVRSILPLVGVTEARKDITNSPAELKASELMAERPKGLRTKEQADKSKLESELSSGMSRNEPDAYAKIRAAVEGKQITPEEARKVEAAAKFGTGLERNVHHLDVAGAMKVWDVADETERQKLAPMLLAKLRAAKSITVDERKQYMATLMDYMKGRRFSAAAGE